MFYPSAGDFESFFLIRNLLKKQNDIICQKTATTCGIFFRAQIMPPDKRHEDKTPQHIREFIKEEIP
jgi:hypothetical protein